MNNQEAFWQRISEKEKHAIAVWYTSSVVFCLSLLVSLFIISTYCYYRLFREQKLLQQNLLEHAHLSDLKKASVHDKIDILKLLYTTTRCLPKESYLTRFSYNADVCILEGKSYDLNKLNSFIENCQRDKEFKQVKLSGLETKNNKSTFKLTFTL